MRPQRAARLPLPSPPGERVRGGAGARSRLCRGPSAERAWRGSGEGGLAAFSPAVRRWQQVPVCTAASAAGAAGAGHRTLAFPAGGLASRVGRKVQGSHFSGVGRQGPHNPTPGGFLEPSFLSLHHCRSCLPPHILIFPARLPSPPPGSPLQIACLGPCGVPTSLGVGGPLSNYTEPPLYGGGACVSPPPYQTDLATLSAYNLAKPGTPGWHITDHFGAFNPWPLQGPTHSCSRPGGNPQAWGPWPGGCPPLPLGVRMEV